MNNLVINDGEIEKISSSPGMLKIIFRDWEENKWLLSIDELIAFESVGAEGETLGELVVMEDNDYKRKIIKLLPEEANLSTSVFIFRSAWSDLPVLQVIGNSLNIESL